MRCERAALHIERVGQGDDLAGGQPGVFPDGLRLQQNTM